VTGSVLEENWFVLIPSPDTRAAAARVSGLLLRLVAGEVQESKLFIIMRGFLGALAELPEDFHESVEILAVLRILAVLGLDSGEIPGEVGDFTEMILARIKLGRAAYVVRINNGITASGL
jgi:hypothetical protein